MAPPHHTLIQPTEDTVALAQEILQRVDVLDLRLAITSLTGEPGPVELNAQLSELMLGIIIDLANGRAISIMPMDQELTTFQAADVLNVSRPFLIKLIDKGEIACTKVGTHRRLNLEEVLRYKAKMQSLAAEALQRLAALSQKYDMED